MKAKNSPRAPTLSDGHGEDHRQVGRLGDRGDDRGDDGDHAPEDHQHQLDLAVWRLAGLVGRKDRRPGPDSSALNCRTSFSSAGVSGIVDVSGDQDAHRLGSSGIDDPSRSREGQPASAGIAGCPSSLSSGRMPAGRSWQRIVTSVPPSASARRVVIFISPEKPGSSRLELDRFDDLLVGHQLDEPALEGIGVFGSLAAGRLRRIAVGERHPVGAAFARLEGMHAGRHVVRHAPRARPPDRDRLYRRHGAAP